MSETSTTAPVDIETEEYPGHGRHRGSVSVQDQEETPHGRHRKPDEQQGQA
ncbi:hypothetical protein AB0C59_30210 [Streptomyces sp. NPDC048664]|uniref:hypothetical protein n=1 Tax=Streptomyces sp. NPDC048664 TaxID=3154505 RepID=UPI00343E7C8F